MPKKKSKNRYRIRRVDKQNITIQKLKVVKGEKIWVNISFHGNNTNSLVRGIHDLATAECYPQGDDLPSSLADLASQYKQITDGLIAQIKASVPQYDGAKNAKGKTYMEFSP